MPVAGKYALLQLRLAELYRRGDQTVELTFDEIEGLVGSLPPSARGYRPWWANSSNSQARAWRDAGWQVAMVSLDSERVRFARAVASDHTQIANRADVPSVTETAAKPGLPPTDRADVVLVGCVKSKADRAAPAKDLYTSALFTRRRHYAERSGAQWYILSGQWGLVHPDQVLGPYDLNLGDKPQSYRRAWGRFVVEQLGSAMPITRSTVVEVHAGQNYIEAIAAPLRELGAQLLTPVEASSLGEMLQWYSSRVDGTEAVGEPTSRLAEALQSLSNVQNAMSKTELVAGKLNLAGPGLYAWWVDAAGAAELSRGLGHTVSPGLIYAGQAGASSEQAAKASGATLASRLLTQHFNGSTRASTFRLTIASILRASRVASPTKGELSEWMEVHLRVCPWLADSGDVLGGIERAILAELNPPLNLDKVPPNPLRRELSRLRREFRLEQAAD